MKTKSRMIIILIALGLLLASVSPALAQPPLPSSFYGTVKINGANAPAGTQISAKINGTQYAYATVQSFQGQTVYSLDVPGDDQATSGVIEGGAQGNTVVFFIGGTPANETAVWQTGTNVVRNLTVIPPAEPEVSVVGPDADVLLNWPAVTTNTQGNPTLITNYQVFCDGAPYFAPDATPGTGNLVQESPNLIYQHDGVMDELTAYYYLVRALNIAGPSIDSNRTGKFSYELVAGQGS